MHFDPPERPRIFWPALWRACLFAAGLWASACVAAPSPIVERALVADPTGQMTLEEAQQARQSLFNGSFDGGGDRSAVWIRLRLAPPSPATAPPEPDSLRLRLVPMWAETLSVYDPLRRDTQGRVLRWDAVRSSETNTVHTLGIPAVTEARDLWIHFQPAGLSYLTMEVLSAEDASDRRAWDVLVQGIALGLLVMLLLAGAVIWSVDDTGIGRAFFFKQAVGLAMALNAVDVLALIGLAAGPWLHPVGDAMADILRALNPIVSLWFLLKVLELFQAARWALRMERLLMVLFALNTLVLLSGQEALFRWLGVMVHAPALLAILLSGFACQVDPPGPILRSGQAASLVRIGKQFGLGLLMASSWIGIFVSGFFKTSEPSLVALIVPLPIAGAVGVLLAISLRRMRMESLQRSLKQRQAELDAQALQSERAERARQQEFMVMLTHELKAPLSTLGLVLGGPAATASMKQHAQRALATMRQVIDHCAQSVEFEGEETPLNPVALSLRAELDERRAACADPGRIELEQAPELPLVMVDRRMLAVILNNLLQNALQYSPPASLVRVRLSRETNPQGAVQRIDVINQAAPGPLPDAGRLFQKYYRGDAAKRTGGSGLGLHLSRLLARRLSGELSYRDDIQFITFTLILEE